MLQMKQRVKYPLTPEAKEAAKALVEAWDSKKINQLLNLGIRRGDGKEQWLFWGNDFKVPDKAIIYELAAYKLIRLSSGRDNVEILLFQELRNAVENDFDVSDFFLTTSAVGTVVYGNLEVREGAIFQSAATNQGDITQNANQLADKLLELLGMDLLQSEPDLEAAIVALKSMDELSRPQKCGKVIQELGGCLGHVANTATILTAISMAVQFAG
jgi:hypothetical protein